MPRMLAELIGGERTVEVTGTTVGEALHTLCLVHPVLRVHLFDEDSRLRTHVRCFQNDRSAKLEDPLTPGDRITVLQAVSGGSVDRSPFPVHR
jgi:sulfur carrier protein ThiS